MQGIVDDKWEIIDDNTPLYEQVAAFIIKHIENGDIPAKYEMPGYRKLAKMFGVGVNTIIHAMQIVQKRDLLSISVRNRATVKHNSNSKPNWSSYIDMSLYNSINTNFYTFGSSHYGALNLSMGLDRDYHFREMFNQALPGVTIPVKINSSPFGLVDLRKELCSYMRRFGMEISVGEVMLTTSVTHGLNTLFIALLGHGTNLLLPHPCNLAISNLVSTTGANIIRLAMDSEGIQTAKLLKTVQSLNSCVLCMPADLNLPTGVVTSEGRRQEIVEICTKYKVPVIEHTFLPLGTYKNMFNPLKSYDKEGTVIHVSQIGAAGFTNPWLGWIFADEYLIKHLNNIRYNLDAYQNYITQFTFLKLLQTNMYGDFLKKLQKTIEHRQIVIKGLLEEYFTGIATWNEDNLDTCIWLKFDKKINTYHLYKTSNKVTFHPGKFYDESDSSHIFIYPIAHSLENLEYGLSELKSVIYREYGM